MMREFFYTEDIDILELSAKTTSIGIKLSLLGITRSVLPPPDTDTFSTIKWWIGYLTLLTPYSEMGWIDKAKDIEFDYTGLDLNLGDGK